MASSSDTIFALATPPGVSAIAVLRLSGPKASAAPALFQANIGEARHAKRAYLYAKDGSIIDDVMLIYFAGPHSPTGEDVLEIHTHGSVAVIQDIFSVLSGETGFRPAQAGEFTRRALDNGKMDITAAEGLADLIDAETAMQRRQATAQMTGHLKRPVEYWRQAITAMLAHFEALIDFAEEELPEELAQDIDRQTEDLCQELTDALDDQHFGEIIRNGLSVVLAGPVNAGKSTVMNSLARREAAIVSDTAGTTRDIIDVQITLSGIPVRLVDTAGLRQTTDQIEAEGIKRAKAEMQQADLVLIIVDGSEADWADAVYHLQNELAVPHITVLSKSDKNLCASTHSSIQAKNYLSLDLTKPEAALAIEGALQDFLIPLNQSGQTPLITRARHREAFSSALANLNQGQALSWQDDLALKAEYYRQAVLCLGRVTGHVDVEELLDHIFSRFCIGK